jgi:hypothetical protein
MDHVFQILGIALDALFSMALDALCSMALDALSLSRQEEVPL